MVLPDVEKGAAQIFFREGVALTQIVAGRPTPESVESRGGLYAGIFRQSQLNFRTDDLPDTTFNDALFDGGGPTPEVTRTSEPMEMSYESVIGYRVKSEKYENGKKTFGVIMIADGYTLRDAGRVLTELTSAQSNPELGNAVYATIRGPLCSGGTIGGCLHGGPLQKVKREFTFPVSAKEIVDKSGKKQMVWMITASSGTQLIPLGEVGKAIFSQVIAEKSAWTATVVAQEQQQIPGEKQPVLGGTLSGVGERVEGLFNTTKEKVVDFAEQNRLLLEISLFAGVGLGTILALIMGAERKQRLERKKRR
jgi:hypothetical protein